MILSIVILSYFVSVNCYRNSNNHNCNATKFDLCAANYFFLFNGTVNYSENDAEYQRWCNVLVPANEKCLKGHIMKCLSMFPRQSLSILRYVVSKYYRGICSTFINRNQLISLAKCWNPKKPRFLNTCFVEFNDHLIEIKKFPNNRLKLPSLCCRYWNYISCGTELIRQDVKKGSEHCTRDHVVEFESLTKNSGKEFFDYLCGEKYSDRSDGCHDLLSQQRRVRHPVLSKRWKSSFPFVIDILKSV